MDIGSNPSESPSELSGAGETPVPAKIKLDELIRSTVNSLKEARPSAEQRLMDARARKAESEAEGSVDYYALRRQWSRLLMILFALSAAFQAGLVTWVGCGWLPFDGHETFLNLVSGELFLQIAGMCYVIVRCLFPSVSDPKKGKDAREKPGNSN